jgi:hypothetical protein
MGEIILLVRRYELFRFATPRSFAKSRVPLVRNERRPCDLCQTLAFVFLSRFLAGAADHPFRKRYDVTPDLAQTLIRIPITDKNSGLNRGVDEWPITVSLAEATGVLFRDAI